MTSQSKVSTSDDKIVVEIRVNVKQKHIFLVGFLIKSLSIHIVYTGYRSRFTILQTIMFLKTRSTL